MLTVIRCRQLLGSAAAELSDDQIESLRAEMYVLAESVMERFKRSRAVVTKQNAVSIEERTLRQLDDAMRLDVEERAAMLQFDAGMPRDAAIRQAIASFSAAVAND